MKNGVRDDAAAGLSVRLSGTGGQGLVLMGRLLSEALALYDGLNVVETKSYGPEARGGASRSQLMISSGEIDDLGGSPLDVLVCLSQKACDQYYADLTYQGLLIVDSTNVGIVPTSRAVEIPMTQLATRECGNGMCTNVVGLGVLAGYANLVSWEALERAVRDGVRPAFREQNLKALSVGRDTGKNALKERTSSGVTQIHDFGYLRESASPAASPLSP